MDEPRATGVYDCMVRLLIKSDSLGLHSYTHTHTIRPLFLSSLPPLLIATGEQDEDEMRDDFESDDAYDTALTSPDVSGVRGSGSFYFSGQKEASKVDVIAGHRKMAKKKRRSSAKKVIEWMPEPVFFAGGSSGGNGGDDAAEGVAGDVRVKTTERALSNHFL